MGIYYEMTIRLEDLVTRCLAQRLPDRLPAGSFASVCGTLFGGIHADTGRTYAVIEPELGGWGGSPRSDGNPGQFSALHGETYNCPAEVAEARYGVTVDYLSFHDEDGGAGLHRGGKGVRIDYRMRSDNAWLTVAYTRSTRPALAAEGRLPGIAQPRRDCPRGRQHGGPLGGERPHGEPRRGHQDHHRHGRGLGRPHASETWSS